MEDFLKKHLQAVTELHEDWTTWRYMEDVNKDALSDDWLENRTSFIYKVGILAAIDANKCDWVYVVIGMQRSEHSAIQIIGVLHFEEGENDDMGRVIKRFSGLLARTHPAFEDAV